MSHGRYRSLDDPETLRQFIANLREGIYITSQEGEIWMPIRHAWRSSAPPRWRS